MFIYIPVYDCEKSNYYVKRLDTKRCRFITENSLNCDGIGYCTDHIHKTAAGAAFYIEHKYNDRKSHIDKCKLLSIMDKTPISEYQNFLDDMESGISYGYKAKTLNPAIGENIFFPVLYVTNDYIRWCHYGSSANKKTARDLKWIINTIFFTDLNGFLRKYEKQ